MHSIIYPVALYIMMLSVWRYSQRIGIIDKFILISQPSVYRKRSAKYISLSHYVLLFLFNFYVYFLDRDSERPALHTKINIFFLIFKASSSIIVWTQFSSGARYTIFEQYTVYNAINYLHASICISTFLCSSTNLVGILSKRKVNICRLNIHDGVSVSRVTPVTGPQATVYSGYL